VPLGPEIFRNNRDWIIPIECKADGVVIGVTGQKIDANALTQIDKGNNPLLEAVQQLISRRQAMLLPGDQPYRPMIRFRMHADGFRTYYQAYPALEALHVPMSRENLDPDEGKSPRP
jgi:hypothetical protein